MHISKNSATQIVEEISKLVKQNINLMDETGHIIASRDKSRIFIMVRIRLYLKILRNIILMKMIYQKA